MSADLLTPTEAAQELDCTPETINAKLAARELPGVKIGRSWRIPRAAFIEHLNAEAMRNLASARAARSPAVAVSVAAHKGKRQPPRLVNLQNHASLADRSSPRSDA
jgi:excisionase family DNA binding protein